ncbi:hypothetical protein RHGRI_010150 [Rhododendron griersonianum]|uniref:Uncharacterized protein n=1 Tax=Rhododendron griersonianum TaxID=479676 RepID=A0AAV6KI41_9ERIC|nr:hypothetical protein RHGRI_010150 [Rhododendron griersonianum]
MGSSWQQLIQRRTSRRVLLRNVMIRLGNVLLTIAGSSTVMGPITPQISLLLLQSWLEILMEQWWILIMGESKSLRL